MLKGVKKQHLEEKEQKKLIKMKNESNFKSRYLKNDN